MQNYDDDVDDDNDDEQKERRGEDKEMFPRRLLYENMEDDERCLWSHSCHPVAK